MQNMIRISRNGVPHYVAPWYRDLTAHGKTLIGNSNNIMAKRTRFARQGDGLTEVEYIHHYDDGSVAHPDQEVREAIRQRAADRALAIAAYEAGHLVTKPEPERIAA